MIDRVVARPGPAARRGAGRLQVVRRRACFDGSCCFGGEESAGASFLRRDGTVWTTDKDGPIMDLLAAEITARTGKDPGEHYRELTASSARRTTRGSTRRRRPSRKHACSKLVARGGQGLQPRRRTDPRQADTGTGQQRADRRPEGTTASGWFAARPSGTENIYKIYAESFESAAHLDALVAEAQQIVDNALRLVGRTVMTRCTHRARRMEGARRARPGAARPGTCASCSRTIPAAESG